MSDNNTETEDDSGYIHDPNFSGDIEAVREHYNNVRPVLEEMALLGDEYPTLGFGGNAGWYQTRGTRDFEKIRAGYPRRARCTLFSTDLDDIIRSQVGADGREREIFNISSWKQPDKPTEWKHFTRDEDDNREWNPEDGAHPPGYDELRGFGFWVDLDLETKDGRESLTDAELATVERVQQRVIETVANAYGIDTGDVYALDSGGGSYIYGPPEAALKIVEYLDDAQEREWFLDTLADRINDGPLTEAVDAILEEENAKDLLDPDWMQNKNRQTKAPGSLHHSHDIVVTPLRDREPDTGALRETDDVDYSPTRISEFSKADKQSLMGWARGLTAITNTEAVDSFLKTLYPERASDADTDDWRDIVDDIVSYRADIHERKLEREENRREKIEEWESQEDGGKLDRSQTDSDGSLVAEKGMYVGAEIVTEKSDVDAAISTIDVREVIKNHACDAYDTSNRNHETTFDPSWRKSGSGESCAIPNNDNGFVDNGCDGGGGPVRAYALGEGILSRSTNDPQAATRSLTGAQFGETIRQMRAEGYSIPVYVPDPTDDNEYEQTPLWALRKAALALGVVDSPDAFVERETDDGGTYPGFADAQTYNDVLIALEEEGVSHGRDPVQTSPEYETLIPRDVRNLAQIETGQRAEPWDWRSADVQSDDTITIADARQRTVEAISTAMQSSDRVLIEALPTMGKSYGTVKAAVESGENITIATGRGRIEQYEMYKDWATELGVDTDDVYILPSFTEDCDCANGLHGDEWEDRVNSWYSRGATPKAIHKFAEERLGRPLPCQENGTCPYATKWDFDPDEKQIIIGHYSHVHKPKVTTSRTIVMDEFPDEAYETTLGREGNLAGVISTWLEREQHIPYESYTDLLENRDDQQRRSEALLWFETTETQRDERAVIEYGDGHALAPSAVFSLLVTEDMGNGVEHAEISEDGRRAVFNRSNTDLSILRPPDLEYASGVVCLDGTPTPDLWELCLDERLNHRPVLQDGERAEYITEALNLNLIQTSEYVKSYNSADHVNVEKDAALLNEIASIHDEQPGVITTRTAERVYARSDISLPIAETMHHPVLGSNQFKSKRVGAVIGSNHYGDQFIKKWAAYAGEVADRGDDKGTGLDYGEFGNRVLTHMRDHDTLQAAMRFGRDGNGAVVYVHTNSLPEWVKNEDENENNALAGEGRVLQTWSEGMRSVIDAVENLESPTTAEVTEYPGVEITQRQVLNNLNTLREKGVLRRERDSEDGRRFVWFGDELHRIGDHGDAELPPVDLSSEEEVSTAEVDVIGRMYVYTCNFGKIADTMTSPELDSTDSLNSGARPEIEAVDSGEPPG